MKQFFTRHWGSCSPIIILAVAVVWSYFIFFRTFFFGTRVSASLKRTEPLQELKNVRAMMHRCPDVLFHGSTTTPPNQMARVRHLLQPSSGRCPCPSSTLHSSEVLSTTHLGHLNRTCSASCGSSTQSQQLVWLSMPILCR
ncbi:uncharacterized protein LOC126926638 isoform X1 [Bombus affinis]|uniref:uncharacterized protein LOC126926638 isoform X1 n=1 Tax=Bombus affinis TaxID=309941 RepID=UPI0021B7047D|nr:uncharacterized protein LOC126926638 isoform X1 [Bombus affinis]